MQKGLKSIDSIESIEIETPVYGGKRDNSPCIWGMGFNFESVGCAFESHRGCHLISRLSTIVDGMIFE